MPSRPGSNSIPGTFATSLGSFATAVLSISSLVRTKRSRPELLQLAIAIAARLT
ncbi:hypothetical protein [Propylenella binzhouense]|uniref:hypothetical protein n=1 Tax=Propylenella binzhouense TaxID=2555902 RepID=UPI00136FD946|nr:hypothetical protein [Propylenella binzhouense]